jgi:hypothetical protein
MDGPTATGIAALIGASVALANGIRQDNRARFTNMITILSQLDVRFDSKEFRARRRVAAAWLTNGSQRTDLAGEDAARDLLNFFETLAFLHRREAVDAEAVWHYFASWLLPYYRAFETFIRSEQTTDPNAFREFAALYEAIFQVEREKRDYKGTEEVVSPENVKAILASESSLPA